MPIYQDDFQSYAVGALSPFASLTTTGFFNSQIIDTPSGIFGNSKSVTIPGISGLLFSNTGIFTPLSSTFFGARLIAFEGTLCSLSCGPTLIGSIQTNADGTISFFYGATRIATSTIPLFLNVWNWFQLNLTMTNNAGLLELFVEIAVEETLLISTTFLTGTSVGSLSGLGIDSWAFGARYNFAQLTIDTLQPIGTDPNPGSPLVRVTQGTIEQAQLPSSALVRVTQGTIEQAQLPSSALIRVTQATIELVYEPATEPLLISCPLVNTGTVGVFFTSQIIVSGDFPPDVFEITGGSLPPGLTLNATTGAISGTPLASGSFSFTVKVTDSTGNSVTVDAPCPITVSPAPPPIECIPLPVPGYTPKDSALQEPLEQKGS